MNNMCLERRELGSRVVRLELCDIVPAKFLGHLGEKNAKTKKNRPLETKKAENIW